MLTNSNVRVFDKLIKVSLKAYKNDVISLTDATEAIARVIAQSDTDKAYEGAVAFAELKTAEFKSLLSDN